MTRTSGIGPDTHTIRVPMRMPNYWRLHVAPWRDGLWRWKTEGGSAGWQWCGSNDISTALAESRDAAIDAALRNSVEVWRHPMWGQQMQPNYLRQGLKALAAFAAKRGIDLDTNSESPPQPKENGMGKSATATKTRKNKTSLKQQKIPDSYDPVPEELEEKVEQYNDSLSRWQQLQKQTDTLREEVIALMVEHDIERVPLNEESEYVRVHKDETYTIKKVKIKKPKVPKAAADAGYED